MASTAANGKKKPASAATNLIAGGGAGMMEALICHPLGILESVVVRRLDLTEN